MTTHMLTFKDKLEAYIHLTRFDKPVGIELVFWSTLWAVFLAAHEYGQLPPWHVVVIFALGATLMRAAGCAINHFASSMILVHNHPSGDPSPSMEDIHITKKLIAGSKILDIEILDHIIVGDNKFTSLKQQGMIK